MEAEAAARRRAVEEAAAAKELERQEGERSAAREKAWADEVALPPSPTLPSLGGRGGAPSIPYTSLIGGTRWRYFPHSRNHHPS